MLFVIKIINKYLVARIKCMFQRRKVLKIKDKLIPCRMN